MSLTFLVFEFSTATETIAEVRWERISSVNNVVEQVPSRRSTYSQYQHHASSCGAFLFFLVIVDFPF